MFLSVSMIVKNEEHHLPRCLTSLQGLADEIIVLDTGSSDRSPEIAAAFGAKVFHFHWNDDFAAARNASLAHCSGDWVLVLDADEAIDPADHANLRSLLTDHGPQAYRLCCRNYLSNASDTILDTTPVRNTSHYRTGREYDYYVDYVIHTRLFRRFPDVRFSGRIHEVVDPYFESRGIPVRKAPGILHHFGKLDAARESYKKDFYLDLCRKEALENPDNYLSLFHLILQSRIAQEWKLCLDTVEKFVRIRENIPTLVLMAAGTAHLHLDDAAAAAPWLERVLAVERSHGEALLMMARCLVAQKRYEEACSFLERAIAERPGNVIPHINLAEVHLLLGDRARAREALLRGIRENPKEEVAYTKLIQFDHQQERLDRAAAVAALGISALPQGGNGLWHRLLVMHLLETGDSAGAASIAELGCQAFPGNDALARLRALSRNPSNGGG